MIKRKSILKIVIIALNLILLVGCASANIEEYNAALQKGLDVLALEDYKKAEVYFELALEEKPEDPKATAYLEQTRAYSEAVEAFESKDFETAKLKAESVIVYEDGLESLIAKATKIISQLNEIETVIANYQKEFDEISNLVKEDKLSEALEKIESLLNEEKINADYVQDIKNNVDKLKEDIDSKLAVKQDEKSLADKANNTEESEVSESNPTDIIAAYNELPEDLKVLLATTTIDERAMSPELMGYNLYYNFDEDVLLVNVHSGAGTGHPWFVIEYDSETITPVAGVVNMGVSGYENVEVSPISVSKVDLYNRYMDSKESYDLALKNVVEYPDMTMSKFNELRSSVTPPISSMDFYHDEFKGYYANFVDEPFNSRIYFAIVITENKYVEIVPSWSEFIPFTINSSTVEGDVLRLSYKPDFESSGVGPGESEITLQKDNGNVKTLLMSDYLFYSVTLDQLQQNNISIPEYITNDM